MSFLLELCSVEKIRTKEKQHDFRTTSPMSLQGLLSFYPFSYFNIIIELYLYQLIDYANW